MIVTPGFAAGALFLMWADMKRTVWFILAAAIHELAHLAAIQLCGKRVHAVRLCLSGAVIHHESLSCKEEVLVSAAGPAAGLIAGIASYRYLATLAYISFFLSVFNLLPVYPMDGGRIFRSALNHYCSPRSAELILQRTTFLVGVLLMIAVCWITVEMQMGIWPIFAGAVAVCGITAEEKQLLFRSSEDKMNK